MLEAGGEESEVGFDGGVVSQLIARAPGGGHEATPTFDDGGSASNPFAVGAELLSLLGSLQDGGPVLLLVDDAHWIDPPSAAALLFALRRLYADRVCALIATRPGGDWRGGAGWSRFLDDAERARRIRLSGLDRAGGPVVRRNAGLDSVQPGRRRATARAHRRSSALHPRAGRRTVAAVAELRARAAARTALVRRDGARPSGVAHPRGTGSRRRRGRRRSTLPGGPCARRRRTGQLPEAARRGPGGGRAGADPGTVAGRDPVRPSAHPGGRVRRSVAEQTPSICTWRWRR